MTHKPWRHPRFLALYARLPHAQLDALAGWLMRRERPRWLVRCVITGWISRARVGMHDFVPGPFASPEAFFLRRLRPGARPIATGLVAPVDGVVVSTGGALVVKGTPLSLAALCGGEIAARTTLVIFLSPDGYHHVHAPDDARVEAITPIEGRTFPQNDDALRARPDVYLQNARVVVRTDRYTLVLVAASLVSHMVLDIDVGDVIAKGQRLGHFTFGSTVVLALPAVVSLTVAAGDAVRMGQRVTGDVDPG